MPRRDWQGEPRWGDLRSARARRTVPPRCPPVRRGRRRDPRRGTAAGGRPGRAELRINEEGLRVEDVDFLRRTVRIRQQRRPGGEMGRLKTGSSIRDILAEDTVLQALAEQIR